MAKARTSAQIQAVFGGFTVTDLKHIFGGSQNDVHKKIGGRVQPCSPPGEEPLRYKLIDVIPFLYDRKDGASAQEIERAIMKMSPAKLPPALQDAFWKAQITRQEYEESKGQLWNTAHVVKVLGEAFKPLAMTLRMLPDIVDQLDSLSPRQREVITGIGDSMLSSLHDNLVKQFADYVAPADEHGHEITEAQQQAPENDGFDDEEDL